MTVIDRAREVIRNTLVGPGDGPLAFIYTAEDIADALAEAGLLASEPQPHDDDHLIEFRDDGWTIQHTLTERIQGLLFDCPRSNWPGGDPGVRGRFVLNDDGTIGEAL